MSVSVPANTNLILVDTRIQNKTIILPPVSSNAGRILILKDYYGTSINSTITIKTQGTDLIDDYNTTYIFTNAYGTLTFICDGISSWRLMGFYNGALSLATSLSSSAPIVIVPSGGSVSFTYVNPTSALFVITPGQNMSYYSYYITTSVSLTGAIPATSGTTSVTGTNVIPAIFILGVTYYTILVPFTSGGVKGTLLISNSVTCSFTPTGGSVTLSITSITGGTFTISPSINATSYNYYITTSSSSYASSLTSGSTTTTGSAVAFTTTLSSSTYYVIVVPLNSNGPGTQFVSSGVTVPVPTGGSVTLSITTTTGGTFTISPSTNATSYNYYITTSSSSYVSFLTSGTTTTTGSAVAFTTTLSSSTYYVIIVPLNGSVQGSQFVSSGVTVPVPTGGSVTLSITTTTGGTFTISPSTNATSYNYYITTSSSSYVSFLTSGTTTTTGSAVAFTTTLSLSTYYVIVVPLNGSVQGSQFVSSGVTVPVPTGGSVTLSSLFTTDGIITITPSTNATSYNYYITTSSTSYTSPTPVYSGTTSTTGSAVSFTTTLITSTTYYAIVVPLNGTISGTQFVSNSATVSSTTFYTFTGTLTFTPAAATGQNGPTLSQCKTAYSSFGSWVNNTAYFNMTTTGIQEWTVPQTTIYIFDVTGACGGYANAGIPRRGYGARAQFTYNLNKGDILKFIVGQSGPVNTNSGTFYGGGGGGGTFIYIGALRSGTLICAIGGGGGAGAAQAYSAGTYGNPSATGMHGYTTTSGGAGLATGTWIAGAGGTNGNGGQSGVGGNTGNEAAGGGAGWVSDGQTNSLIATKFPGVYGTLPVGGTSSFDSTWNGGFGGGAAGGFTNGNGAGGAGGYSGGGGSGWGSGPGNYSESGGGGGSFVSASATSVTLTSAYQTSDGYISITIIPPYYASSSGYIIVGAWNGTTLNLRTLANAAANTNIYTFTGFNSNIWNLVHDKDIDGLVWYGLPDYGSPYTLYKYTLPAGGGAVTSVSMGALSPQPLSETLGASYAPVIMGGASGNTYGSFIIGGYSSTNIIVSEFNSTKTAIAFTYNVTYVSEVYGTEVVPKIVSGFTNDYGVAYTRNSKQMSSWTVNMNTRSWTNRVDNTYGSGTTGPGNGLGMIYLPIGKAMYSGDPNTAFNRISMFDTADNINYIWKITESGTSLVWTFLTTFTPLAADGLTTGAFVYHLSQNAYAAMAIVPTGGSVTLSITSITGGTFTISPSTNATSYNYYITTSSSSYASSLTSGSTTTTGSAVAFTTTLSSSTYYVIVVPLNGSLQGSQFVSSGVTVLVPTGGSVTLSSLSTSGGNITITASTNATSYNYYITTSSTSYTSPTPAYSGTTSTTGSAVSFTTTLTTSTTYYAIVVPLNGTISGTQFVSSGVVNSVSVPPTGGAVTLTNLTTTGGNITITASAGATSYNYWISTSLNTGDNVFSSSTTTTGSAVAFSKAFTAPTVTTNIPLPPIIYYALVVPTNTSGPGPQFNSAGAILTMPTGGLVILNSLSTTGGNFTITASANTTSYSYWISTSSGGWTGGPTFNSVYNSTTTTTGSGVAFSTTLSASTTYYVIVIPSNAIGQGPEFVSNGLSTNSGSNPTNPTSVTISVSGALITANWGAATNVTSYNVRFYVSSTNTTTAGVIFEYDTSITALTKQATNATGKNLYYYCTVQSVNASAQSIPITSSSAVQVTSGNNYGYLSTYQSFTIPTNPCSFTLYGAGGGYGAAGNMITVSLNLPVNTVVNLAAGGSPYNPLGAFYTWYGGWPGGGTGGFGEEGAGGGGYSAILSQDLTTIYAIAAGGGGGTGYGGQGGAGGYPNGVQCITVNSGTPATGGTQSSGGSGFGNGSYLLGGTSTYQVYNGGGGGGGYYGGGAGPGGGAGGGLGGGGGGSSYYNSTYCTLLISITSGGGSGSGVNGYITTGSGGAVVLSGLSTSGGSITITASTGATTYTYYISTTTNISNQVFTSTTTTTGSAVAFSVSLTSATNYYAIVIPFVNSISGLLFVSNSASFSSALYTFIGTLTFTPAGATGRTGPTLSQCTTAYSSFGSWVTNTAYFNMTQAGYQTWTVPSTRSYTISVAGAGSVLGSSYTGVIVNFTIALTQGQILNIVVGQLGLGNAASSGGGAGGSGGTFLVNTSTSTLIAVGGGAGGYNSALTGNNGAQGATSTTPGFTTPVPYGGTGGSGGSCSNDGPGGSGAGYVGNGLACFTGEIASLSYGNGATGGGGAGGGTPSPDTLFDGGFGGGGGAYFNALWRCGGGGGYSGGGSGGYAGAGSSSGLLSYGGGGGSYIASAATSVTYTTNTGQGYVSIT